MDDYDPMSMPCVAQDQPNRTEIRSRLGLYLGSHAIGWCLYETNGEGDPNAIKALGVRAYADGRDPKTGLPLAKEYKAVRAMRRRRDRYLQRRERLLAALADLGLMPKDPTLAKRLKQLDPYALRAKGLDKRLEPYEIGRAIFHLNQRRGFVNNRQDAGGSQDTSDSNVLEAGAEDLAAEMNTTAARTLGEFLQLREQKRFRANAFASPTDFRVRRELMIAEFEAIWAQQAKYHSTLLTEDARAKIEHIVFHQRKPGPQANANCPYFDNEPRLPRAHPIARRIAVLVRVNRLRIRSSEGASRVLTLEQRDAIAAKLSKVKALTFAGAARLIGVSQPEHLSMVESDRQSISGDLYAATLARPDLFGSKWNSITEQERDDVTGWILGAEDAAELHVRLASQFELTHVQAKNISNLLSPAKLSRTGLSASRAILGELEKSSISYQAAARAAFSNPNRSGGPRMAFAKLPYYGEILSRDILSSQAEAADPNVARWGRVANPSFHICLNQLRILLNAILDVFGRPDEVAIEIASDLRISEKEGGRIASSRRGLQRAALEIDTILDEAGKTGTPKLRTKIAQWLELPGTSNRKRFCPYCAQEMTLDDLWSHRTSVGRILPFSRTLDESRANCILAHTHCHAVKGQRSPWEAWGATSSWEAITKQSEALRWSKRWRFLIDAMDRFEPSSKLIARQLTSNSYIARMARAYVASIFPSEDQVFVHSGRLSETLRWSWRLEEVLQTSVRSQSGDDQPETNGCDTREFASRAAIAGATTVGLLTRLRCAADFAEGQGTNFEGDLQCPLPWTSFKDQLGNHLSKLVVSHKAEHGRPGRSSRATAQTTGRLHMDTAYGLTDQKSITGVPLVVHRIPFSRLSRKDLISEDRVVDGALRGALLEATQGKSVAEFEGCLREFALHHPVFRGIRRLRVREAINIVSIKDRQGNAYKGFRPRSNHTFIVWEMPDGHWQSDCQTTFDAHQPDRPVLKPHPAARKVLQLCKNDLIAIERVTGKPEIMIVRQFTNRQISLAAHWSAGRSIAGGVEVSSQLRNYNPTAERLRKLKARQVRVDVLGRTFDPQQLANSSFRS